MMFEPELLTAARRVCIDDVCSECGRPDVVSLDDLPAHGSDPIVLGCRPRVVYWKDGLWGVTCRAHPRFGIAVEGFAEAVDLAHAHVLSRGGWRPIVVSPHTVRRFGWQWFCTSCLTRNGGFDRPSEAAFAGRQHWATKHAVTIVSTRVEPLGVF